MTTTTYNQRSVDFVSTVVKEFDGDLSRVDIQGVDEADGTITWVAQSSDDPSRAVQRSVEQCSTKTPTSTGHTGQTLALNAIKEAISAEEKLIGPYSKETAQLERFKAKFNRVLEGEPSAEGLSEFFRGCSIEFENKDKRALFESLSEEVQRCVGDIDELLERHCNTSDAKWMNASPVKRLNKRLAELQAQLEDLLKKADTSLVDDATIKESAFLVLSGLEEVLEGEKGLFYVAQKGEAAAALVADLEQRIESTRNVAKRALLTASGIEDAKSIVLEQTKEIEPKDLEERDHYKLIKPAYGADNKKDEVYIWELTTAKAAKAVARRSNKLRQDLEERLPQLNSYVIKDMINDVGVEVGQFKDGILYSSGTPNAAAVSLYQKLDSLKLSDAPNALKREIANNSVIEQNAHKAISDFVAAFPMLTFNVKKKDAFQEKTDQLINDLTVFYDKSSNCVKNKKDGFQEKIDQLINDLTVFYDESSNRLFKENAKEAITALVEVKQTLLEQCKELEGVDADVLVAKSWRENCDGLSLFGPVEAQSLDTAAAGDDAEIAQELSGLCNRFFDDIEAIYDNRFASVLAQSTRMIDSLRVFDNRVSSPVLEQKIEQIIASVDDFTLAVLSGREPFDTAVNRLSEAIAPSILSDDDVEIVKAVDEALLNFVHPLNNVYGLRSKPLVKPNNEFEEQLLSFDLDSAFPAKVEEWSGELIGFLNVLRGITENKSLEGKIDEIISGIEKFQAFSSSAFLVDAIAAAATPVVDTKKKVKSEKELVLEASTAFKDKFDSNLSKIEGRIDSSKKEELGLLVASEWSRLDPDKLKVASLFGTSGDQIWKSFEGLGDEHDLELYKEKFDQKIWGDKLIEFFEELREGADGESLKGELGQLISEIEEFQELIASAWMTRSNAICDAEKEEGAAKDKQDMVDYNLAIKVSGVFEDEILSKLPIIDNYYIGSGSGSEQDDLRRLVESGLSNLHSLKDPNVVPLPLPLLPKGLAKSPTFNHWK